MRYVSLTLEDDTELIEVAVFVRTEIKRARRTAMQQPRRGSGDGGGNGGRRHGGYAGRDGGCSSNGGRDPGAGPHEAQSGVPQGMTDLQFGGPSVVRAGEMGADDSMNTSSSDFLDRWSTPSRSVPS